MRSCMVLLAAAAFLVPAGFAGAQTPDAACAADSLYLISPEALDLHLQTEGRLGMVVSWPDLDLGQATCFSLSDTAGLRFPVVVTGGFGDQVDRVFRFSTADSGSVGGAQSRSLTVNWLHEGPTTYGSLSGQLNLANNGGFWRYNTAAGTWAQENAGLPMSWKQVNVVAMDQCADGCRVAALTRGQTIDTEPAGLYRYRGGVWTRLAQDIFGSGTLINNVKISPSGADRFVVGTTRSGLFVTRDGGQTFTQWTTQFGDPFDTMPTTFTVRAVSWVGDRLFVFLSNYGLFVSDDDGLTFSRLDITVRETLDVAESMIVLPTITSFSGDPNNPDRILATLLFHGVFESLDGGQTWHDLYGDLVVPVPGSPAAWVNSALSAVVDPGDPQRIVQAIEQKGLYVTADGGDTWVPTGVDVQPANLALLTRMKLLADPTVPGRIYALEDGHGLLVSADGGLTWSMFSTQLVLKKAYQMLLAPDGSGDLVVGTHGGGIYVPGTPLALSDTYDSGTSSGLRSLDLGLEITLGEGVIHPQDEFRLVGQTFQGWAVWRASADDRENPVLVGLFDRVNPEDCTEGYCGDRNYEIIPQCFAAKRAACFNFDTPDTIRYFDDEVYNGFSYYYSVTSFDYGNTALTTPQNNTNEMLFSPRWPGDELSPFAGWGNQSFVQVNLAAAPAVGGDEIYVFPNPLRPGAGIPGGEGRTVVFTNLPVGSRIRIFTTAGDDIIDLGPELQNEGQMYWQTDNRDGESIAPGVYLYKVEMPQQEPYWGRLVVIR